MNIRISKSKFVAGCQCPKRLYFQVHQPELAAEPDASASHAVMDQGQEVGLLARQMFPGGVEVGSGGLDQAIRTTRELVANPRSPPSSRPRSSTEACWCGWTSCSAGGTTAGV